MGDRDQWWSAVEHAASGRYATAWTQLDPLQRVVDPAIASLASSTAASLHRQLGRHSVARGLDELALALLPPASDSDLLEALLDALIGLAADAVGMADAATADARMHQALGLLTGSEDQQWRAAIRICWIRAELGLLTGRPEDALIAAIEAVERSARSARHLAKSLLFQGVVARELGMPSARGVIAEAADLAASIGVRTLEWPAYALLGAQERAWAAIEAILEDVPPDIAASWQRAPDVAAIRSGVRG